MRKLKEPDPNSALGLWSLATWPWSIAVIVLLAAWALRLCCLGEVPPGWRDDELINIYALSGKLLEGHFPLYFTGASGHEPLYHYLHTAVHCMLGFNVLSGHLLSVAFGTMGVALTYSLTRRLFGHGAAAVASAGLATSFWSLMYSRTAIRHISLPPFALAAFYLLWRWMDGVSAKLRTTSRAGWGLVGLVLGASLYTYPAARLLPVVLVLFAAYLRVFHRERFRRHWGGFGLSLVVAAAVAAPLGVAVARGQSEAAAQGIGADARLAQLAVPLRGLLAGNVRPLLRTAWTTLGMFHALGDPEWLYNISGRPVFNLLGGLLLWAGVVVCLYRWRQPRFFFLLLWLGLGLAPAFVSTPAASLSHTMAGQPVAYVLPAVALTEAYGWLRRRIAGPRSRMARVAVGCSFALLTVVFLTSNAVRDLRDYFIVWPQEEMVRLLYRADYREAARYLSGRSEATDVAVSSALLGPWDRLALQVDTGRDDVAMRLFNPERALVWVTGGVSSTVLLTSFPRPARPVEGFLEACAPPPKAISPHLALYELTDDVARTGNVPLASFANGLELVDARWMSKEPLAPGQEAALLTSWLVGAPLDLPPMPIVANPPPPGVYSGPRLAVFTHLLDSHGSLLDGDDGLWVDPLTLQAGDRFVQIHRFSLPPDALSGPYTLELGLYDPMTGERWAVLGPAGQAVANHLLLAAGESGP